MLRSIWIGGCIVLLGILGACVPSANTDCADCVDPSDDTRVTPGDDGGADGGDTVNGGSTDIDGGAQPGGDQDGGDAGTDGGGGDGGSGGNGGSGGSGGAGGDGGGGGTDDAALTAEAAAVGLIGNAGAAAETLAESMVRSVANMVFTASPQSGGALTLTGTLTAADASASAFNYSPQPADKLLVDLGSQGTITFTIQQFQGNLNSASDFVSYHSALEFDLSDSGGNNAHFKSVSIDPDGPIDYQWERTIAGTVVILSTPVTVELDVQGGMDNDVSSGVESVSETRVTGTASGGGASMTIDNYTWYHLVSTTGAASNRISRLASSGTYSGSSYAFQNYEVKRAFFTGGTWPYGEAGPTDLSYWSATGQLARDGGAYGSVRFDGEPVNSPKTIVELASGKLVTLP